MKIIKILAHLKTSLEVKHISFFVLLIAMFVISSCTKYAEGPTLSLRTKTERVHNNWKISFAKENGEDVTGSYQRYELDLSKNGDAGLSKSYNFGSASYQYTTSGKWIFTNNKDKISFDFDNNNADGVYTILKLKENEMWLSEDGKNLELHFVTR